MSEFQSRRVQLIAVVIVLVVWFCIPGDDQSPETDSEANEQIDTPSADRAHTVARTTRGAETVAAPEFESASVEQDSELSEAYDKPADNSDPIGSLLGFGFKTLHSMSKVGNEMLDQLAGLTIEEEVEIGKLAFEETVSLHSVVSDEDELARINRLAKPFLGKRKRQQIEYTFTIIDDKTVNAFAHLGGFVYVNTGLLAAVRNDDELRFIIGHEIAHVDRRHCVKSMTVAVKVGQSGGDLAGVIAALAYQAIAVGYSEEFELDSDQWSYRQMRSFGRTNQQSISGLKLLESKFGSNGDQHAHGPMVIEHLEDHFRTHPRIGDRISRLEKLQHEFQPERDP